MGILNITPDSFYAESRVSTENEIVRKAEEMLNQGAEILDVGGYSTRPGAGEISEQEELDRVTGAVQLIRTHFEDAVLSVDTFRAKVAEEALRAGASMINDISGGEMDPDMWPLVRKMNVPYVIMHMRGTPQTMMENTHYDDLLMELIDYFQQKIGALNAVGINDVIIDPGLGFSKTLHQNYEIIKKLDYFKVLERPLLIGVSRKSMIYKVLDCTPEQALNGTTALNAFAIFKGAKILRVHDVKEAVEVIKLYENLV